MIVKGFENMNWYIRAHKQCLTETIHFPIKVPNYHSLTTCMIPTRINTNDVHAGNVGVNFLKLIKMIKMAPSEIRPFQAETTQIWLCKACPPKQALTLLSCC